MANNLKGGRDEDGRDRLTWTDADMPRIETALVFIEQGDLDGLQEWAVDLINNQGVVGALRVALLCLAYITQTHPTRQTDAQVAREPPEATDGP